MVRGTIDLRQQAIIGTGGAEQPPAIGGYRLIIGQVYFKIVANGRQSRKLCLLPGTKIQTVSIFRNVSQLKHRALPQTTFTQKGVGPYRIIRFQWWGGARCVI